MQDITNQKRPETSQRKRKAKTTTGKNSKQCKIGDNIENITEEQKIAYKEREIQIQVQEAAARKALAEAEALELANIEKKKALGLF
jgi:hypothetical protein